MVLICLSQGLVFSFQELQKATENFSRPRAQNPQKAHEFEMFKTLRWCLFAHPREQGGELWWQIEKLRNRGQNGWVKVALVLCTVACSRMVQRLQWRPRWNLGEDLRLCLYKRVLRVNTCVWKVTSRGQQIWCTKSMPPNFQNLGVSKRLPLKPGDRRGQTWTTFASLIDMSGVAECSRVRFRRWGIAFLGFRPREDSTLFFLEKKGGDMIWTKIQRGFDCKVFFLWRVFFHFVILPLRHCEFLYLFSLACNTSV